MTAALQWQERTPTPDFRVSAQCAQYQAILAHCQVGRWALYVDRADSGEILARRWLPIVGVDGTRVTLSSAEWLYEVSAQELLGFGAWCPAEGGGVVVALWLRGRAA